MRIKQHVVIMEREDFLRGNYEYCFSLVGNKHLPDDWTDCGEIEIDVNVDTGKLIADAAKTLDEKIEREREAFTVRLQKLEGRKRDLLALTHEPEK